jgi:Tol biopolymer transport system component
MKQFIALRLPRFGIGITLLALMWSLLAANVAGAAGGVQSPGSPALVTGGRGGKIAFAKGQFPHSQIYVMNADGTGERRLTFNDFKDLNPCISPDGSKIAFVRVASTAAESGLIVMNADGSNQTRLTADVPYDATLGFTNDSRKVVFLGSANEQSGLFSINVDGTGLTHLTGILGDRPVLSPDGSKIAFLRRRDTYDDDNNDLYIMNTNGSGLQKLVEHVAPLTPRFSADSRRIVYNNRLYNISISWIDWQTGVSSPLIRGMNIDSDVSFSPQGDKIVFSRAAEYNTNRDIYRMKLNGDELTALTADAAPDVSPSWGQGEVPLLLKLEPAGVSEGNVGAKNATFTLRLEDVQSQNVTLSYQTRDGSAQAGGDYQAVSGTLTIVAGQTTQTVSVPVYGDTQREANEAFFLQITQVSGATPQNSEASCVIANDDVPSEPGDERGGKIAFVRSVESRLHIWIMNADGTNQTPLTSGYSNNTDPTLSADGSKILFVRSAILNDPDGAGIYLMNADGSGLQRLAAGGSPRFSPDGNRIFFHRSIDFYTTQFSSMNLEGSDVQSVTEFKRVGGGYQIHPDARQIVYSDGQIYNAIAQGGLPWPLTQKNPRSIVPLYSPDGRKIYYAVEQADARTHYIYTMNLDGSGQAPLSDNQSHQLPGSFSPDGSRLAFTGGTSFNEQIGVMNADGSNPQLLAEGFDPSWGPGFVSPTISINRLGVRVPEGNSGTTNFTFTVTLSTPSPRPISVSAITADAGAKAPADYTAAHFSISFGPGEVSKTITVQITGDTTDEIDETFLVHLSSPINATISHGQGVGVILNDDDDMPPLIYIDDLTLQEGQQGQTVGRVRVRLSAPSGKPVSGGLFLTEDSGAQAAKLEEDYPYQSGLRYSFAIGSTTTYVEIKVNGDLAYEADETLLVKLSDDTTATFGDGEAKITIVNDDRPPTVDRLPTLAIQDVTVIEGNATQTNPGPARATFTVSLSAPSIQTIIVNAATYNGSARSDLDYTATTATLVFNPGETTKTFSVPIKGDLLDEADETLYAILSSPTNASIVRGRGVGTITDDDRKPALSITDARISEGNSGTRTLSFTISLSTASGQAVTVNYASANGTANASSDYAAGSGLLTFAPGQTTKTVIVGVKGDTLFEANETLYVLLTGATNATVSRARGTGIILNDDSLPTLTINDTQIAEGNSGTKTLTFTITLSKASNQSVSVNYATADGIARSSSDYVAKSGTLAFAPGSALTRTINIPIRGDTLVEGNETLFVLLSGQTNAGISKGRGVGTITNDDSSG